MDNIKTSLTIDDPARKWQHANLTVEIPNGWHLNQVWGRYHSLDDLHFEGGYNGEPVRLVIGLRRPKEKAIKED